MEKINIEKYVTKEENIFFYLMLIISILLYILLTISLVGIFYIAIFAIFMFMMQGIAIGQLRQNAIKITNEQFPDIYEKIEKYSKVLDLKEIPSIYLLQSGGLLNAFATRFLFKDIVVIYSDILELAYEQGENALEFIIAHELAHIKRKHLSKMKYIACAQIIPFLGLAYSRACEYTCDRIAAAITPKLPIDGLLVLCAGKKLYKQVNTEVFIKNAKQERNYWERMAEFLSTHPSLSARIEKIANMERL